MLKNTPVAYGLVTKLLHLIFSIFVIGMITLGLLLETIGNRNVYNIHKLIGLCLGLLSLFWMFWLSVNTKPLYPISMPKWQKIAAKSVQHSLLLLILMMSLSGLIFSSAGGKAPHLFNWTFSFPGVLGHKTLGKFFNRVHWYIAWILIAFICVHILGALKHLCLDKDDIFRRMWRLKS